MDKIAMLTDILKQNPNDSFARYGLAMAFASDGRTDEALQEFGTIVEKDADYVPAYQMAAQQLLKAGRTEEARGRLTGGLEACERTGNTHAASEMQAMLDDIS